MTKFILLLLKYKAMGEDMIMDYVVVIQEIHKVGVLLEVDAQNYAYNEEEVYMVKQVRKRMVRVYKPQSV